MSKISNSHKIQRILKESQLLCQNGKIIEAKPLLQELLKSIPSHPAVLSNLGSIELQQGNFDIGIEYLEKSLKANPKQPQIICNLANGFLDSGKSFGADKLAIILDNSINASIRGWLFEYMKTPFLFIEFIY